MITEDRRIYLRKYHAEHRRHINAHRRWKYAQKQTEQPSLFAPVDTDAPRCHCGRVLMSYDLWRGECFHHALTRVRMAREGIA